MISKTFGDHLDGELTFKHHINKKINNKANKGIEIIRKLKNILSCST